ncbi:MAG: sulfatase-like hydrolase/transferase, partial [Anaerohalosphaera sp.]|nr:sulfatase-like hydrolase/transferase [Anaerohalosphaera sp.]
MGWGDVGYNGNQHIKTPNLDDMAKSGIRFDRWYAGAPVCSPTRGSCVTGRHPYRYGIFYANQGHIKSEEVTLAEALKTQGYTTGHFGKWHLGTLTKTFKEGRRGGRPSTNKHYSPPWENGFDECFSTEMSVPTWDPMENQNIPAHFWVGPGKHLPFDDASLKGDGSRVIMDRAIPFIQKSSRQNTPFLAVIWFFAPHNPVVAGPKYKAMYSEYDDDKQHYYGCITALDEQVGRLREELKAAGIADNTMLWFCSDNGPAGKGGGGAQYPGGRMQGVAGPFRGRKGSLYEGGVRVPGMLEWPDKIKKAHVIKDFPCSTSDYFPTTMEVLGFKMKGQPETIDGISLLPLIEGKMKQRATPIGFESK